jgi:hypothetical protein
MAGMYGEIDSRDDFYRLIDEARAITGRFLKAQPRNWTIESIDTQLDAMKRWTAGGRVPTQDERKSIKIGLLAVRELDAEQQDDSGELARKLYALNNYFDDWPDDADAASATDDDYWKRFGL